MRTLAGPTALLHFTHLTHLSAALRDSPSNVFRSAAELAGARCHRTGVFELLTQRRTPRAKVCLLDPTAAAPLAPDDGDRFRCFLFGVHMLHVHSYSLFRSFQGHPRRRPPRATAPPSCASLGSHAPPGPRADDDRHGVTKLGCSPTKRVRSPFHAKNAVKECDLYHRSPVPDHPPFTTLRTLPPGAFMDVDWSVYIPHL
ncbi:hypothetical protein B0H17DRAFT_1251230 [Mycena rosella]|uniref:Uncharacterized protein n=1 Tax=Mycena rosella TaxID=1033263 RepID=A0AAD7GQ15_MYCRO|nr:hypothetical protein B0H17DRAFT_1251230 [Mycena rosella]